MPVSRGSPKKAASAGDSAIRTMPSNTPAAVTSESTVPSARRSRSARTISVEASQSPENTLKSSMPRIAMANRPKSAGSSSRARARVVRTVTTRLSV